MYTDLFPYQYRTKKYKEFSLKMDDLASLYNILGDRYCFTKRGLIPLTCYICFYVHFNKFLPPLQ